MPSQVAEGSRLVTDPPYGLREHSPGYGFQLPEAQCAIALVAIGLYRWYHWSSTVMPLLQFTSSRLSLAFSELDFLQIPGSETSQKDQTNCSSLPRFAYCSSGQSSPHTSNSSLIFSPSGSNSSRSTPSSHNSYDSVSPQPPNPFNRRQPRIQVSSLLADSHTRSYHLEVVQHPQKTAEFRSAGLSRLPLTPPVIVQLIVRDPSGNSVVPEAELPFLIAHLSLMSADGVAALDMGSSPGGGQTLPPLYGNLVSSLHHLEDLQGNLGLFFIFPDVSVRYRGCFRLRINLLRLMDPAGRMTVQAQGTVLATTLTRPFDVLRHDQYTAAPPTRLTQCFLRQGARMFTYMSNPNP